MCRLKIPIHIMQLYFSTYRTWGLRLQRVSFAVIIVEAFYSPAGDGALLTVVDQGGYIVIDAFVMAAADVSSACIPCIVASESYVTFWQAPVPFFSCCRGSRTGLFLG